MITKTTVTQIVSDFIKDSGYYLVDIIVSGNNEIKVEIDSFQGVNIDFCAELSNKIESALNRDDEDFELEVGSAGLTSPFKVRQQYEKNLGKQVEVLTGEGKKFTGILTNVDADNFEIEYSVKEKAEGAKRKSVVTKHLTLNYTEIKYTKYNLIF
ncbi:MAG: ribosome assembly cofactor RimP [Paludibacter sp.]|jgi:ribosome maturation factor RimP|nr:ribosome assembly cofactor RimP [Paludibacter sp.]